ALYEFAFDSLGNGYYKQGPVSTPGGGEPGALQMGPNGQIYMAVNGSSSLWYFQANEDTTQVTNLANMEELPLVGGSSSTLGLPNFIQNISTPVQGPTISVTGTCLGSPTQFNGGGRDPNIEFYSWNFGDGTSPTPFVTDPNAEHQYDATGTYQVALTLRNRCDIDTTLLTTVVITAPPDSSLFIVGGGFPVLCDAPVTIQADADDPGLIYVCSTADSTRQIQVNRQVIYTVTILDG